MHRFLITLAIALVLSGSRGIAGDGIQVVDGLNNVPAGLPAPSEVLRNKLQSLKDTQFAKARCELVRYRISESRCYPLVGTAKLAEGHFKVTVWSAGRMDIFLVDEAKLIRDP